MQKFCIPLFYLIFASFLQAQDFNLGNPFTKSYSKKEYKAGTQSWDIVRDGRGIVFFANNEGMIQFDGRNWTVFPLPNRTIVRSLAIDNSGKIYAGGQNELGFFFPDKSGNWLFKSLKHLIPERHKEFSDVWNIAISGEVVYFRTSKKLYRFQNGVFQVFNPSSGAVFNFLASVGNRIYVQDSKMGLHFIQDSTLILIPNTNRFNHSPITGMLELGKNEWLITTLKSGCYKMKDHNISQWIPEDDAFLREKNTYASTILSNGTLAFGTSLGGLLIVHPGGQTIHRITRENGLLNNKVLSLMSDAQNNLWLGLDNGINYVLTGLPFTHFSPDGSSEGAGYAVIEQDSTFYFGTSNGLYSIPQKDHYSHTEKSQFKYIENTKGQVWGLNEIDNNLLLAHHGGGYVIRNGQAELISKDWGYWLFELLSEEIMLAGTYTGLAVFYKENGNWVHQQSLQGFDESSRFLQQDDNHNIWVAHPYKGIYKLKINAEEKTVESKKYGSDEGLPSSLSNHLFKIENEIIFCGEKEIFIYDDVRDSFVPYDDFNQIFGKDDGVRRLFQSSNGDIWYITQKDVGVLSIKEKSVKKEITKTSLRQIQEYLVNGFEFIYPLNDNSVFFGTEIGFIHYKPSKQVLHDPLFQVVLNQVSTTTESDSLIFGGNFYSNREVISLQPESMVPLLPANTTGLRFNYSASDFAEFEEMQFQFYLEGLEDSWLEWTNKFEKEYTNLAWGDYTFHLKAKNQRNVETTAIEYRFSILPHWYETYFAYGFYLLLIAGLAISSVLFFIRIYSKQKEKVKITEKEVHRLKNENLQTEVAYKNRELAAATFHLVHKNEILSRIKLSLSKIQKRLKDKPESKSIESAIKMLETEENSESGWDQFISHFDSVHTGFFDNLKNKYPDLTAKDLKMCAYLRMNLSTKEIASLCNITIRGVEGGRYRIRKKMNLEINENLTDYILKL